MFYNSVRKIFSIYWFYDLYKGLIGLYQKSEVSLMHVRLSEVVGLMLMRPVGSWYDEAKRGRRGNESSVKV